MKKMKLALIALTVLLAGCVYHPTIEQGNILTPANARAIHPGMTSQAVVAKLGSPVLQNAYADGRMVYIYTSQASGKKMVVKQLEIDFQNNRVVNVRTEL